MIKRKNCLTVEEVIQLLTIINNIILENEFPMITNQEHLFHFELLNAFWDKFVTNNSKLMQRKAQWKQIF